MIKKTELKLRKIALEFYKRWDIEGLNFENLEELVLELAGRMDIALSKKTFRLYEKSFIGYVKMVAKEDPMPSLNIEKPIENEMWWKDKVQDETITIEENKLQIKRGNKIFNYVLESIVECDIDNDIRDNNVVELEEEDYEWTGLFNYNGGKVVVNLGQYAGCDFTDAGSVKNKFGDRYDMYSYIMSQLNKNVLGKVIGKRSYFELKKNIETLLEYKEKIEKTKGTNLNRLAIIRGNKNWNESWIDNLLKELKQRLCEV